MVGVDQPGRRPVEPSHELVDEERTQLGVGAGHAGQQAVDVLETEGTDQRAAGHHGDVPVMSGMFQVPAEC